MAPTKFQLSAPKEAFTYKKSKIYKSIQKITMGLNKLEYDQIGVYVRSEFLVWGIDVLMFILILVNTLIFVETDKLSVLFKLFI